ncbi:DUF4365 domain-containing protein [Pseudomonas cichorii]|nr:DUF4365 domain-containing protein [Pseudomonas cichorii]
MARGFPTYTRAAQKGDRGVDVVSRIFNEEFEWLFKRNHQEHDFGIDAQVDVVLESGAITGQMLALQIKYGSSFFKEENKWGYVFRGEQKHFNYLANYPTPVLIIICHPDANDCYWAHFDPCVTSKAGNNWKITIPFENKLETSKVKITDLLPPPADYLSEVEGYWAMNDIIVNHKFFLYIIDRADVEALDFSSVRGFFDRIRSTRELAEHCQGKIEISFHGYDQDPRELFEILEVRAFASYLSAVLPELLFFAYTGERSRGLRAISLCLAEIKRPSSTPNADNKIPIEYSTEEIAHFLDKLWPGLNELTEWLNMTIDENKKITFDVIRALGFSPPTDDI